MLAGLDVGRRHDRSALVRMEGPRVCDIRLGSGPLPVQARILVPLLRPCLLTAVDATGLGLGLAELLAEAGLPVLMVQIVRGDEVWEREPGYLLAGKGYLIGRTVAAVSGHKLAVPLDAPGRGTLLSELSRFIPKWKRSGHVAYEASAGHDDTVLALALALLAGDVHDRQAQGIPRSSAH